MRKMATIRRIAEIRPIEGADKIEVALVDGWNVVIRKGEFKVDDIIIYFEIDSWIPSEVAPFLTKSDHFPKEFNGVKGERLKTVKLRGQISQGLILPRTNFFSETVDFVEGDDVSDLLGIQKWERPLSPQLAGMARGNFPSEVPKTDQERCQNLVKEIRLWAAEGVLFERTEKLDGSSCTYYLDLEDIFHVCSRNIDLKDDGKNTFWKVANNLDIAGKMRYHGMHGKALQGELIGEGIQGNKYAMNGHDFRLFDIYDVREGAYLPPLERDYLCNSLRISHVPIIGYGKISEDIQELLREAEGVTQLPGYAEREGIVYKSMDGKISFKAISNKFLLKGGE